MAWTEATARYHVDRHPQQGLQVLGKSHLIEE